MVTAKLTNPLWELGKNLTSIADHPYRVVIIDREGIMGASSFIGGFSLVEVVILGFITMNFALSGFYFVHRGVKKATAAQTDD